jgi:hydroxymethylpyrimidine pyrophosphatase-like HAD family hydrolase
MALSLGIDLDDVVVLGDHQNDIPMLQIAGLPIAMGNAKQPAASSAGRRRPFTTSTDSLMLLTTLFSGEMGRVMIFGP